MSIESNKEVIRNILAYDATRFLKEGGYPAEGKYHSLSYKDHGSLGESNLEQISQFNCTMAQGFPDFKFTIEDMVGEGDRVAVRYRFDGTHLGEYMRIPPTGKKVLIKNQGFFLIKDGKLEESWRILDMLNFLQQMRLVL
jgi:predicted ester cyclase